LGQIISKLNKIFKKNLFEGFVNEELRNALGHDDWWIKNNLVFCYRSKGKIVELDQDKFTDIVSKHNNFSSAFHSKYGNQYCTKK